MNRYGGSFAPPIGASEIKEYGKIISDCTDASIKAAMGELLKMVKEYKKGSKSARQAFAHPSGVGRIVPLEDAEVQRLDSFVPWPYELDSYAVLFDAIDPVGGKKLRDAAFHLLWFGRELCLDREPCTKDML